jgi:hypothetical protein
VTALKPNHTTLYHVVTYKDGELHTTGVRNSTTSQRDAKRLAAEYNYMATGGFSYSVMTADQFRAATADA